MKSLFSFVAYLVHIVRTTDKESSSTPPFYKKKNCQIRISFSIVMLFNLFFLLTVCVQIFVTFSAVFGVVVYRICMLSVWSMNPDPEAKASVRMTVTTTGIILNMLVVLVLEEVYGAIAVWLTELGIVFFTFLQRNAGKSL